MSKFTSYNAYKKLKKLSENPFDLVKNADQMPERIRQYHISTGGFKLMYAAERIHSEVIDTLCDLAKEAQAIHKMREMQSGKVINCIEGVESENRSVLHTAMRAFVSDDPCTGHAKEAKDMAKVERDKLEKFLENVEKKGFTDLVTIGIGGSDLGPRALYLAMQPYLYQKRRVHFVSNVDPDDAALALKGLDLKKTLVLVISKSGSTLETRTNEALVKEHFIKAHLDPKEHFVAVTGKGSPMDDPKKYLASFYIWDFIGGRYSATSMIGAVMLGFALGMDQLTQIWKGAHFMDQVALKENPKENLPLFSALLGIWNRNFLNYPTLAILPYSQALWRLVAHLQQCDMESNGKHIDKKGNLVDFHTGPLIWGEAGTNGQHSFYQLIHQGTDIIPIEFVAFLKSQCGQDLEVEHTTSQEKLLCNVLAQSLALATGKKSDNPNKDFQGNRPNHIIVAHQLDPFTLGALLAYYEHRVAFQGFIWDINSFDQEGVQLGKVLANKFLSLVTAKKQTGTYPQEEFPVGKALLEEIDAFKEKKCSSKSGAPCR